MKVLLVDDEPEVLEGLELALRRERYELRTASSGQDAMLALPPFPSIIRGRFDPFQWAAVPQRRSDIHDASAPVPTPHIAADLPSRKILSSAVSGSARISCMPSREPRQRNQTRTGGQFAMMRVSISRALGTAAVLGPHCCAGLSGATHSSIVPQDAGGLKR